MKEYQASEELQLFFKRLYEIKDFIKDEAENNESSSNRAFAQEIYDKLHKLIKTEEEHEKDTKLIDTAITCDSDSECDRAE